ncbi:MAG: carboxynorspermidine decarboxylase [Defluviitaleaceae bacterium]|nr:carboxynorspermidine decarboxylase [Defluviitaleaceae bacterium]
MSDATRSLEAGINSGGGIGGGINADTGRRSEVESKKNNAGGNLHRCKNFGIRVNPEFSTQENSGADGGIYDPCSPGSRLGVTLENFRFDAFSDDARSGAAFDDVRSNDAPSEDASSVGASSGACSNDTPSDDAPPFGARSDEFSNGEHESIRLNGLHFHTLCQQNSDALEATLHAVTEKFGSVFDKISWVNFGGGHHITRPDYDIDRLVALIKNFRAKYPHLQVYLEPGEAVALNAGFLHCTVLDIVQNGGNIAILDASAACHMPDVLEMPYTPRVVAPQVADGGFAYTLAGPTCLAGDIIGAYSFEKPLSVGDTVVFDDMAIYSMVKTNTFNGMNLPAIAKRRADGEVQIVRQFGYDDFKNRLS